MTLTPNEYSSNNVPEQNNNNFGNSQLIEKERIEDTPFTVVKYDEAWFLTMGKYRLTDPMATKEMVLMDAQRSDWTRILQIIQVMIDQDHADKAKKSLNSYYGQPQNEGGTNQGS